MHSEKLRALLAGLAAERHRAVRLESDEPFAGLDSIAKLEALLAIEAAFGISLDDEALARVRTFAELEALVAAAPATPEEKPAWLAGPLPAPAATWGRAGPAALAAAMRVWFRLGVSGRAHLPAAEACLLCANHASHLDGPALLAAAGPARGRLVFAAAKDYFFARPRLAAWSARALPLIPWERGGDLATMRENLRHLAAGRASGRIVVFFPEGGRSPDGTLQPFKEGLAFFAEQLGLPVVPAWIGGTHRALPKGASFPRPGRLKVAFGEPLRPAPGETSFAETVRERMLALREAAP
jgi:1-acyl-sn-glycerol-3-phosphate acyltransferase/long-chain acyl-CoA synthetase